MPCGLWLTFRSNLRARQHAFVHAKPAKHGDAFRHFSCVCPERRSDPQSQLSTVNRLTMPIHTAWSFHKKEKKEKKPRVDRSSWYTNDVDRTARRKPQPASKALFTSSTKFFRDTVVLSFVCGNYYQIID